MFVNMFLLQGTVGIGGAKGEKGEPGLSVCVYKTSKHTHMRHKYTQVYSTRQNE